MATTSGKLAAGTASGGWGGNGKGGGRCALRVKVAAGVALLGCVAALAVGEGEARLGSPAQAQPVARVAAQQVVVGGVFSPIGRTGPADEYLRGDFADIPHAPQRSGPADEYTQPADLPLSSATHGIGPADEYSQIEDATGSTPPDRFTYREDRRRR